MCGLKVCIAVVLLIGISFVSCVTCEQLVFTFFLSLFLRQ